MAEDSSKTPRGGAEAEIFLGEAASELLNERLDLLAGLIRLQVDETFERSPFRLGKARARLCSWLETIMKAKTPKLIERLLKRLKPPSPFFGWTRQEDFDWSWNEAQELLKRNSFALATLDGKIAAIAAYKLGGRLADGRDVYELTKFITHPAYRGRGVYHALRPKIVEWINQRHPGAALMTFTKNGTVIKHCEALGWRSISKNSYSEITRRVGRSGISAELMDSLRHWRAFLYEP